MWEYKRIPSYCCPAKYLIHHSGKPFIFVNNKNLAQMTCNYLQGYKVINMPENLIRYIERKIKNFGR